MKNFVGCLCLWIAVIGSAFGNDTQTIKIGFITELSGNLHNVGLAAKNAAFLAVKEINNSGGIKIGDTNYKIDLVIADSNSSPTQAAKVAQKLITEDQVVAIIGPNTSSNALPVSEVAEQYHIAMITPWATATDISMDKQTGKTKKYVFRACFSDAQEAENIAKFIRHTLNIKNAAILFDGDFPVFKEQADLFQTAFIKSGGTIVAFKNFGDNTKSFNELLTLIKNAEPEIIFMPSYYSSVAPILSLARQIKITAPFIGSDGWGNEEQLKLCGPVCVGSYVINHYSPNDNNALIQKFVSSYQAKYGALPNDIAALTYDAFQLLVQALQNASNPFDRQAIQTSLAQIRTFDGVTGTMRFNGKSGDPIKTGTIIKIKNSPLDSPV